MIETVLVEVPEPRSSGGCAGVSVRCRLFPPPAAIANAIYNATGVRMLDLPMSPPRVTKAILEKNG